MAGGHATASGMEFQCEVGAWVAAHILTSQPIKELGEAIPSSLQMEAMSPVDDIVVKTNSGGVWFINVKVAVGISTQSKSPLASVVDQFVRQWLEGVPEGASFRSFDVDRDRLVLVTKPSSGRSLVRGATAVIQRINDGSVAHGMASPAYSETEVVAFDALGVLLKLYWERHTGEEPAKQILDELISCVRLIEFEMAGPTVAAINTMLSSVVAPAEVAKAMPVLINGCLDFSRRRSGGNEERFRALLRGNGVQLLQQLDYQQDIASLQEMTRHALVDMSRYASVCIAGSTEPIQLSRACSEALLEAAAGGQSCLVIGDPGAGKSGSLQVVATKLLALGRAVILVQVDQLVGTTLEELQREFSLSQPLIDTLAEWHPNEPPILMIDALDASRGTGSESAVRSLLNEVRKRATHWTVIASIRKFDLRYGSQYHRLFEGNPINDRFVDEEFRQVRHINIPRLGPDEIDEVEAKWPALKRISQASGAQFRSLLSSPFNLFLLGRILKEDASSASMAKTQLDLLGQFWSQRVEKDEFVAVEESALVMDGLLRRMLRSRRLTALNSDVSPNHLPALDRLLRDGVLYQPKSTRVVSFAHHVLFDYALANLVFLRDDAKFLDDELVDAAKDVLLVAPAIVLALRVVWERETSRRQFWRVSLSLAADNRLGSFIHSLPARVAAEATSSSTDVDQLVQELQKSSDPAISLARHLLSAVLAGVVPGVPRLGQPGDPWCKVVEMMAEAALEPMQWPLNSVLGVWAVSTLTADQRESLSAAARRLLTYQLNHDAAYHGASISSAIKAVLKTYEAAPQQSEKLIRALLDSSRVEKHGHSELFWLAHDFRTLAESNPQLAADFLVSAFSAPLPSRDDKTYLGDSRILSLTSNKRQDFEGILYQLERHLPWFLEHNPGVAGRSLRALIAARIDADRPANEALKVGEAQISDRQLKFRIDHSCVWWSPGSGHHDINAKLVDKLCSRLKESDDADFVKLQEEILLGDIPSVLVAVFLRAAAEREDPGAILQLLLWPDVLEMLDTSYDAAELVKAHYSLLSSEQKTHFQDVVASLEDQHRKLILLGVLPVGEPLLNDTLQELKTSSEITPATNQPHFIMTSGWGDSDGWSWFKDSGVDTDAPANRTLLDAANELKTKALPDDDSKALEALVPLWRRALEIVAVLEQSDQTHLLVRNQVLDAVADLAVDICKRSESEKDLIVFPGLREALDKCLIVDLKPLPVTDAKREVDFAESPSWGRPAPRIPASEALMLYIRAIGHATDADFERVLLLARDPAVEVRHTVLARANVTCQAAPELSKQLAEIAFSEETNEGVLSFFLGAFDHYANQHLDWAPELILALESRLVDKDRRRMGDLRSVLVRVILRLWVTWNVTAAGARLEAWVASPLVHRREIDELLMHLRDLVVYGEVEAANPREDRVRSICLHLFEEIVKNLAAKHRVLLDRTQAGEDVRQELTDATQLLDSAADHLYFGSGAYAMTRDAQRSQSPAGAPERCRFVREYLPTLRLLAQIPYPSVTHPILQIIEAMTADRPEEMLLLLFDAIHGGGQSGGYQFESLGADLVVAIARRFLADFSGLLTSKAEYRSGLVDVLNLFANTGWPEPRKLVYQLPEMLR